MHIYIYIYTYTYIHTYIYIYRERERDRERDNKYHCIIVLSCYVEYYRSCLFRKTSPPSKSPRLRRRSSRTGRVRPRGKRTSMSGACADTALPATGCGVGRLSCVLLWVSCFFKLPDSAGISPEFHQNFIKVSPEFTGISP